MTQPTRFDQYSIKVWDCDLGCCGPTVLKNCRLVPKSKRNTSQVHLWPAHPERSQQTRARTADSMYAATGPDTHDSGVPFRLASSQHSVTGKNAEVVWEVCDEGWRHSQGRATLCAPVQRVQCMTPSLACCRRPCKSCSIHDIW